MVLRGVDPRKVGSQVKGKPVRGSLSWDEAPLMKGNIVKVIVHSLSQHMFSQTTQDEVTEEIYDIFYHYHQVPNGGVCEKTNQQVGVLDVSLSPVEQCP